MGFWIGLRDRDEIVEGGYSGGEFVADLRMICIAMWRFDCDCEIKGGQMSDR